MVLESIKLDNSEYARLQALKAEEERRQLERDEALAERERAYKEELAKFKDNYKEGDDINEEDLDVSIEDMPDCLAKYYRICERSRKYPDYRFVDP